MSLLMTLIEKGGLRKLATATAATVATQTGINAGTVAEIATVAVANPEREYADCHKPDRHYSTATDLTVADSWASILERAAIMEFDGGLDRDTASYRAFMLWFKRFVTY